MSGVAPQALTGHTHLRTISSPCDFPRHVAALRSLTPLVRLLDDQEAEDVLWHLERIADFMLVNLPPDRPGVEVSRPASLRAARAARFGQAA